MTLMMGAHEGREFISFDVPGAFLQAELPNDKLVLLKFRGEKMVDLMCEADPGNRKNVRYEGNTKVLYLKVVRAIYGCIESALQWYKLFTGTLEGMGFKLNAYDKCIANKIINGKQCTIVWHVDDCIASHMEPKVLETISAKLISEFGETEINRGRKHSFLGMDITINEDKTISIDMRKQIREVIATFEAYDGILDDTVTTPGAAHLFKVNPNAQQLDEKQSNIFHSLTATLLYLMQRARPDIEPEVAFLRGEFRRAILMIGRSCVER